MKRTISRAYCPQAPSRFSIAHGTVGGRRVIRARRAKAGSAFQLDRTLMILRGWRLT